jgi:hypothetical protein
VNDAFLSAHSLTKSDHPARSGREQTATLPAVIPEEPIVGGTGQRTIVLRGDSAGEATFHLQYAHAYDPTVTPALTYQVTVEVRPNPKTAYLVYRVNSVDLDPADDDPDDDTEYPVVDL